MVKDHISEGTFRDYAFIEYFTIEEAAYALEKMKQKPMYLRGEMLSATYSKIKRDENLNIVSGQQVLYLI